MGCHTWFYKPATEKELIAICKLAYEEANDLFKALCRFHDVFRVKNYSRREIHSMRELRRFLRKRYFELTEDQHRKCVEFFRLYPGGFICFG